MIHISAITTLTVIIAISCSEAAQYGALPPMGMQFPRMSMRYPPMNMQFPQMNMPNFGMSSMPMYPMPNFQEMMQAQMEAQARQHQLMMEHQRLMNEAIANAMAQAQTQAQAQASTPQVAAAQAQAVTDAALAQAQAATDAAVNLADKLSSVSSESNESAENSVSSSKSSEEVSTSSVKPLTGQVNLVKPVTGLPSTNFQSVSYSTSSSNINGVPSSKGHMIINDNGQVTSKVF